MAASAFAQFAQKLIRRNVKWVFLQYTADDDHRVGSHDVNDYVPAKLGEIVRSYDRVSIKWQNIVQARFVLH